jgi:hypothetical protein
MKRINHIEQDLKPFYKFVDKMEKLLEKYNTPQANISLHLKTSDHKNFKWAIDVALKNSHLYGLIIYWDFNCTQIYFNSKFHWFAFKHTKEATIEFEKFLKIQLYEYFKWAQLDNSHIKLEPIKSYDE